MIVIRNAGVLRADKIERATVVIEGDTITSIGAEPISNGARVIDAQGSWLGPGLVDLHVHLRDPGQTWKEDVESGARAAATGGFTAIVAMPNTQPPVDGRSSAIAAIEKARAVETLDIVVAGTLTKGRVGKEMAGFDAMYEAGVRVFSDDGEAVPEAGLLRRIMAYLGDLPGALVAEHAEDRSIAGEGHMHEGMVSSRLGIAGLPGIAEDVIVARDIAIAADTGAPLHVQHVSTMKSVDLIRAAREAGTRVTAEVTPHHLALDETSVDGLDPNRKMYPPLRGADDRAALRSALREGVIDAVATDHAPHSPAEKAVPFEEAPRGVIGLETAAAVVATYALGDDQRTFFDRMSVAPARIAGLDRHGRDVEPGSPANLVLFDPKRRWVPGTFVSKSQNSPFAGLELTGKVLATIHEGRISFEGGLG
ncbi:MAG: dihydroorotase [Acidimicrobiia bacterium]